MCTCRHILEAFLASVPSMPLDFFFSSRRRHTRLQGDWSSDVCSSDVGPAGSINSNVEDMAQYLLMYLNKGKHGETQVLSESNVTQMTTPQMVSPSSLRYPEIGHASYGMGLGINSYRGHKMVSHGGAIDGFTALLSFLPQDNVGVVVLTNLESDRNS